MDASQQIQEFADFLESYYYTAVLENIRQGKHFLNVDFSLLSRHSPELAELLLETPEEVLKAGELAIKNFPHQKKIKRFSLRFYNLPPSQTIAIRNIRAEHIGRMVCVEGIVRQKSDVRPQVTSARFECPSCGNILTIIQNDQKFKEPSRCGCGRKGKFKLIGKELADAQKIVLEESPESLEGGSQPKRLDFFMKYDLVAPLSDKKTNPGSKIRVTGVVIEIPIPARDGGQLTRYDLAIEVNHVESIEEDFDEIEITDEEKEKIEELASKENIVELLVKSIAPGIYGHEEIKEAIILQLMGGVKKVRDDGGINRGDMHVLLVGDPGAGKSQLIKRAQIVAPKSRYVSGKGASAAGLTASVVKDDFLKGWALEAGALVLANKGFAMIDEMDKMSKEDQSAMHEALEQQTVTIAKASIQATLRCETTVLAAANPKWGRFDPYEIVAKQIDMPPALISRFDLIFPVRDLPNKENDAKLAGFLLRVHQTSETTKPPIETELLRKFIAYARSRCKPRLSEEAITELQNYYVSMRNKGEESAHRSIPITARQLEALVRLSEASAKTRLSQEVEKQDAHRAIRLLDYCMRQIGVDPDTGEIDVDVIATGISSSSRNQIITIKELITELEGKVGKQIPVDDLVALAQERNIDADKVDELIEKLKRSGDIFEPKRGFIQKI
ncbi:AAA family ATPase [Candidatus Woesearchaeota archaeon]|nr:MAG: AAA family ATPase [Candidatus Woesearchaeota archaeon]